MPDKQVVGIVGMGPIGTILGAYLAKSGVKVYGVENAEARLDRSTGRALRARFRELERKPLRLLHRRWPSLAEVKNLTAIFLCTKTWAIRQA